MSEDVKQESLVSRVVKAFDAAASRVESFAKEHTDDPDEKIIADAIIDVFEEISDMCPFFVDKAIDYATRRVRTQFDIPDNDTPRA